MGGNCHDHNNIYQNLQTSRLAPRALHPLGNLRRVSQLFPLDTKLDLLRKDFRSEMFRFRRRGVPLKREHLASVLRRSKNYEAYTVYMLNNFCKAVVEIWRLQQKNLYAVGLLN